MTDELVVPDYGGGCVTELIPALLGPDEPEGAIVDPEVADATDVAVIVADRRGRRYRAPASQ